MSGIDVSDVTHAPFPESFRVAVIVVGDFVLFGSVYVIFARTVVRGDGREVGTIKIHNNYTGTNTTLPVWCFFFIVTGVNLKSGAYRF